MDPLQGVGGSERQRAGQQLVQGDAQRVEIAPGIDRAVHAPGLFRGHVGERAGDDLGRRGRLALAGEPGRDAEAGEPHVTGVVDERVRGLDVPVDDALPVGLSKRCRQADGDAQEAGQIDRLSLLALDDPIQGLTAGILEDEDRSPLVTSQRERLSGPSRIELTCERVFVFEPPKTLRRRLFGQRPPPPGSASGRRALCRGRK